MIKINGSLFALGLLGSPVEICMISAIMLPPNKLATTLIQVFWRYFIVFCYWIFTTSDLYTISYKLEEDSWE